MPLFSKEQLDKAFDKVVDGLLDDTATIMHGSGDVIPSETDPETVKLVASLTAQYISKLVDAALDTHAMMRDNPASRKLPWAPPAAFKRSRQPPLPPPPQPRENKPQQLETIDGHALTYWRQGPRKHQRSNTECWDLGLPPPKIRKKEKVDQPPTVDEWVGVAGVDFYENRTRAAYCKGPTALTTQAFVFPVCHDVYLYGRIMQVQAAKRNLDSVLQDAALLKVVRDEGKRDKESGGTSDPEDDDEAAAADEFEDGPNWPGMSGLLPVHRLATGQLRSILD